MSLSSIAINRFGLGARPTDSIPGEPRQWLLDQFAHFDAVPPAIAAAPASAAVAARLSAYYETQRNLRRQGGGRRNGGGPAMVRGEEMRDGDVPMPGPGAAPQPGMDAAPAGAPSARGALQDARQEAGRAIRREYAACVAARMDAALMTNAPFVERLVHFWANHFAVSADKLETVGLAGTLEFEAIRPHVLGRFADMLSAVERHPAMLLYLDQAISVGPDSAAGQRIAAAGRRKVGLNENLAREILELHTLGVRTGYTQADVTEFARALTGWTVSGISRGPAARRVQSDQPVGSFTFAAQLHQPGERVIVGKRYPAAGEAQAQAVLADLAASEATALHLATKLARHFAGDTPPPAMVERLRSAWLRSGGDLPAVYRAIVASPEAWAPAPVKFRTPWEWAVASYRALGTRQVQPGAIVGLMNQLGQPVWKPGQPVGYDDVAASWAGPDALMRRVRAAERFAARTSDADVAALSGRLFPGAVSPPTAQGIARAESPAQALALLLASPEMMRR